MLIFSGRGYSSILVFFASMFLMIILFPKGKADPAFIISLFATAAFSWYFGQKWNNEEGITALDSKTKRIVKLENNHSLFFIAMQYWGYIFSGLAIVILYQNSILLATLCLVLLSALIFLRFQKKPKPFFQENNQPIHSRHETRPERNKVNFSSSKAKEDISIK